MPMGGTSTGAACGDVKFWPTSSAPAGWLKANGAAVSRTTYAALFAIIGTTYGAGDGSTTFNLPDLRGEFVRGLDDGRGVDSGRAIATAQAQGTQEGRANYGNSTGNTPYMELMNDTSWSANVYHYINVSPANLAGASGTLTYGLRVVNNKTGETRPRNVAMLACIKY